MATNSEDSPVDITTLPIEQLNMLRKQLDQEVQSLMQNYQGLGMAKQKFVSSKRALDGVSAKNDGKDVLVPLTASLFVSGTLHKEVLVDIGTGYFVPRTSKQAQDFMERKVKFLEQRLGQLEKVILSKKQNAQQILQVLQQKVKMAADQGVQTA